MKIAIIPARIGSKRIKKKNIKKFLGTPIILRTINNLLKMKFFNKIVVSSDSLEILNLCRSKFNVSTHLRPKKYSRDEASTTDAVRSCIKDLQLKYNDDVCCVYSFALLLKKKELQETYKILKKKNDFFILPVKPYNHPVDRSFELTSQKKITNFNRKNIFKNTQTFKTTYHDAGQFYWGKVKFWLSKKPIVDNTIGYPVSDLRFIDIDNINDWKMAELLYKLLK